MVASSSIDSFKVWRGEGVMLAIIRSPEIMLRESWRNVSFSAPFNVFNQVYPPLWRELFESFTKSLLGVVISI
jgi:hypothetical protein